MSKNGKIKINLKNILEKQNISMYRLSQIANIKYDVIKRYCLGNPQFYKVDTLLKLCDALNCGINDLIVYEKVR